MKLSERIKNLFKKKSAKIPAPTFGPPKHYTKGACIRRNACGHVVEMFTDGRPKRGAFGK